MAELFRSKLNIAGRRGGNPPSLQHEEISSGRKSLENIESSVSSSSELNCDDEFSQSLEVRGTSHRDLKNSRESFVQSVIVVPASSAGKYTIYTGAHAPKQPESSEDSSDHARESFLESLNFGHNIGNPDVRKNRFENETDWKMRRNGLFSKKREKVRVCKERSSIPPPAVHLEGCQCGKYHCHRFKSQSVNMTKYSVPRIPPFLGDKLSQDLKDANQHHMILGNIFWNAQLNFCEYKHGLRLVRFPSLWPSESTLQTLMHDGIEELGLKSALWELCHLVMVGGPVSVLKVLLDINIVRADSQFDGDAGLLHLACVLKNMEAVQLLTQYGVSNKIKDKSGKAAEEVCFCPRVRKQLPTKYLQPSSFLTDRNKVHTTLKTGVHDSESIFKLAANPKCLYEVQKKLQMFDFNVNKEKNKFGDCIIHVACRAGLCQLPLVMSLVRLQDADVNLCNGQGSTPLMIVAEIGDSNMCDTLMCLLGADPNMQNKKDGKTALHFATIHNHVNVVSCLLKRGADVNLADNDHCRPDDLLLQGSTVTQGDCQQLIKLQRAQRCENLSHRVKNDTIYPVDLQASDLTEVCTDGYTLVMIAAIHDRVHNVDALLRLSTETINAQHWETGLTALSLAAKSGHDACCDILLRYGANTRIHDMKGYLALHHAVLNNHERVVDVFIHRFPSAYVGLYMALRLCRKSSIHDKITKAWERRQDEIVAPQLRICAMDGNAEKLFCELEDGDNVNSKSNLNNQSALFVAVENGYVEVIKLLVQKGADIIKRDQRTGNTVLHSLALAGQIEAAKETANFLLECCRKTINQFRRKTTLDINAQNNDKKTALQIAAEKPRFDHNLRDKHGNTPLMVACKLGRDEVVKFFLESAVYANHLGHDDDYDNSDADSGVTDLPPWKSHTDPPLLNPEDALRDMEKSGDYDDNLPLGASCDFTRSLNPSDRLNTLPGPGYSERGSNRLQSYLTDIERPKGLYIYHDGIVSHVCAVNLFDGNTPLHHTVEKGDSVGITCALIEADSVVVNMQNDAGLTPVHLACKLGRKKILEKLLAVNGVDLSLLTLNGNLPEELTKNRTLIKMVLKARKGVPISRQNTMTSRSVDVASLTESLPSIPSTAGGSTINFDKVNNIYQSLKHVKRQ